MKISASIAQKKLMTPGPVPVPEYVRDVFAHCHIHHRRKEFDEILVRTLANLKKVFQTEQACFALPATGTGAMEAAIVNALSPGDEVLVIDAGKFGERWRKMAEAFCLRADVCKVDWGEDLDLDVFAEKLGAKNYRAVLVQACETSTGAAHPIKEMAELCRDRETLLIVDAITALAAYDLPMDRWGIDVLIGGSQKGFMLPTGMAFISLSAKAWAANSTSKYNRYYWDLVGERKANQQGQTRYSTPVQFIVALDLVLKDILEVRGLASFFAETRKRARVFRDQVNLPSFAKTPADSLSCLRVPEGVSAGAIVKKLDEQFKISIVAGQDEIKDKVLRISHMGDMTEADLMETAAAINSLL